MTTYDFETGSPGNTASLANTGLSAVVPGAGNTITIDNVGVVSGANSLAFTCGGTTSCWAEAAGESGEGTTSSYLIPLWLSSDGYNSSGGSTTLWQKFQVDNATTIFRISVTNAGALTVSDQGTAHTNTLVADVTGRYGNLIVVRLQLNTGTTTADGSYTARYYTSMATAVGSPVASSTASTWNIGAGASGGKTRFGLNSGQATNGANGRKTRIDYYVTVTGTSFIASPAAPTAPTANAGVDLYGQAGTTFTLSGSGTPGTSGGSINGYAWSLVSRSDPAMTTPSSSAPTSQSTNLTNLSPGVYTYQLVVTQTGGGLSSTPDQVKLWVHPGPGVRVKPFSVTKAFGITLEGTQTRDVDALSDTDPASILRWPDPAAGQMVTIVWNPIGPGSPPFEFGGYLIAGSTGTVNRVINHYLEDGTTLLDGPYPFSIVSESETPEPAGLDAGAVAALTTDLSLRRALVTTIVDTAA